MADPKKTLEQLIEAHGGVLVRSKKHRVYKFPNGLVFTIASTPRCPFAYDNALTDLRNLLGLNDPNRGQPGERRDRKPKHKHSNQSTSWSTAGSTVFQPTWKDQLAAIRNELR